MNKQIKDYQLATSSTALNCRRLLEDLPPAQENRQGKQVFVFLYILGFILIYAPISTYITFSLFDKRTDPYAIMTISVFFIGMFATMYLIALEYKLYAQNNSEKLKNSITPLLEDGEKILTFFIGKPISTLPPWINTNISAFCYFIFTTDRMLIITLTPNVSGINQLDRHHINNSFHDVIDSIYSCSLEDPLQVKFGGLINLPIFNLTHSKLIATPIGESIPCTWMVASKQTNNGRLLKTIIARLPAGPPTKHSQ